MNKEVMLHADVYKIRFRDSLGFGIGTGHDVTNFDKTGFYYKSGLYKDDDPEHLKGRIHAEGVESFRAGTLVTIYEVNADDDNVKLKFKTTGTKLRSLFDKKDGVNGFKELYKQVFVVDNREEILSAHPDWSPDIVQSIRNKELKIGMTTDQVAAAMGPASRTKKSMSAEGTFDIWDYAFPTKTLEVTFGEGIVERVDEIQGQ